jgi:hypothetical protein
MRQTSAPSSALSWAATLITPLRGATLSIPKMPLAPACSNSREFIVGKLPAVKVRCSFQTVPDAIVAFSVGTACRRPHSTSFTTAP